MDLVKKRGRKTKDERMIANREKLVDKLLAGNKFILDSKFHSGNKWSMAHFESWAAQGKAGSCPCGCGWYNGTLRNKRANTKKGGRKDDMKEVSVHLCNDCITLIEKKLGVQFKRDYAR